MDGSSTATGQHWLVYARTVDSIEGACFAINLLITPQRFALINILIVAGINELKSFLCVPYYSGIPLF